MQILVDNVVKEILNNSHLFLSADIATASATLQRMQMLRVVEPTSRLDLSVREKLKSIEINKLIKDQNFPKLDGDIFYDRRK